MGELDLNLVAIIVAVSVSFVLILAGIIIFFVNKKREESIEAFIEIVKENRKAEKSKKQKKEEVVGTEIDLAQDELIVSLQKEIEALRNQSSKIEKKDITKKTNLGSSHGSSLGFVGPQGVKNLRKVLPDILPPMPPRSNLRHPLGGYRSPMNFLPARDDFLRRKVHKQFWHQKTIPARNQSDVVFFRELSSDHRVSNMEMAGSLPIQKAATLKSFTINFPSYDDEADVQAFYDHAIFKLHLEGESRLEFIRPNYLESSRTARFDLGDIPIGAGQSFSFRISFSKPIASNSELNPTIILSTVMDEPIT